VKSQNGVPFFLTGFCDVLTSDGSGSKMFDPVRVRSNFFARVGSAIFSLGMDLENFP